MQEHIAEGESSPYTKHLLQCKERANAYGLTKDKIQKNVRKAAIGTVLTMIPRCQDTTFAMSIPGSGPRTPWFRPKPWVSDSGISKVFAEFRCMNAGLGNRYPALDGKRHKLCPLCKEQGIKALNNEVIIL